MWLGKTSHILHIQPECCEKVTLKASAFKKCFVDLNTFDLRWRITEHSTPETQMQWITYKLADNLIVEVTD